MRKFSVPYNNANPVEYLKKLDEYKEHVDSIYFGFSGVIINHISNIEGEHGGIDENEDDIIENTKRFLELSKGKYKRVMTVNKAHLFEDDSTKYEYATKKLLPLIEEFGIDAIIVADYRLAKIAHTIKPELEIQTSCNCYQFVYSTMDWWNRECGVTTFNPPREILRMPSLLRELSSQCKKRGFKLKCIVNEPCTFGCPMQVNHSAYLSYGCIESQNHCLRSDKDPTDILKSNFVLPRHLHLFDPYVDIFKIAGRSFSTEKLFKRVDAYVNERNDVDLKDCLCHVSMSCYEKLKMPVKMIPDKLLTCECKSCNECKVCEKVIEKFGRLSIE